jgi:hypothetical protein
MGLMQLVCHINKLFKPVHKGHKNDKTRRLAMKSGNSSGENMIEIRPRKNYPPHSMEQSHS